MGKSCAIFKMKLKTKNINHQIRAQKNLTWSKVRDVICGWPLRNMLSIHSNIFVLSFHPYSPLTPLPLYVGGKLGQIIWLKNYLKNLTFVLVFSTQIGLNQVSVFVSHSKQIPFLKSNNVKYCQIMLNVGHFETFLVLFKLFLHVYCTIRN